MIYEGHDQPDLLRNGLAISRAIHDRYKGDLRNPYNEIENARILTRERWPAMESFKPFVDTSTMVPTVNSPSRSV